MREEIQRLETVLKNTSQYLDEDGNLVNPNPRTSKPNISLDTPEPAQRVRDTTKAIDEQKTEVDKLDNSFDDLGMTFTSAFEDAIVEGKKFSDVLRSMAQDIVRLMARRMVTEPLMGSLSSVFDSVGQSVTGALGGLFGGAFANGGQPPVGRMSLVGERGAELFVPRVNGTIVPNEMLGGSQNVYNIDARGTDSSVIRRLEQTIQSLAGAGVIEARVADAQRRGAL
jgi:hypothetical protein